MFRAGTHLCALALDSVVEIMRPLPVEPLAGQASAVAGICVVRGEPAPVLTAAVLVSGNADEAVTRFITVAGEKAAGGRWRPVVLAVDSVLGVREIESEALHELPPLLDTVGSDMVGGLGVIGTDSLLLLRSGRLLPESVPMAMAGSGEADGGQP